jgi:hypothetical protein
MTLSRILRTGYLLPRILLVLGALDILLRFVPLKGFTFRALEAAQRRTPSCVGPFQPNSELHVISSYGDLSSMGNLRTLREYRDLTFKTDSMGFHNSGRPSEVPETIVIGDSFAIAAEVSEDRSLAGQLSLLRGRPVYNAGEDEPLRLGQIRNVTQMLGMQRGYVIYEFLERHLVENPPLRTATGVTGLRALPPEILGARRWDEIRLPIWRFIDISPSRAIAQKIDKSVRNGVLFPNPYSNNVPARRLRNNDTLLFYPLDVTNANASATQLSSWVDYWSWLSAELRNDNLTLLVLLVPNKYTVYQPLFLTAEEELSSESNLHQLEQRLREKTISAVNLTYRYRLQAATDLDTHIYIYWKDDTHWNERGMKIAAEAIQKALEEKYPTPAQPINRAQRTSLKASVGTADAR